MGVKGLTHFIRNNLKAHAIRINFMEAARGKSLVIDALSFIFYCFNEVECKFSAYEAYLNNFLQSFASVHVELIFVFDGMLEPMKQRVRLCLCL